MTDGFSGIVGHRRQLTVLERAMARNAVAPSWLFHGPAGVGKMSTARIFAAALLCGGEGGKPCGTCPSCRVAGGGAHPDLLVQEPDAKTPKGPRSLRIEHVRGMQDFLSLRSGMGGRRVCLLDGVETMKEVAANALLKTLEEPPGGTVIVLVTSSPGRLPPTVHSRCCSLSFAGLPEEEVVEVLRRLGWSREEAVAGARASDGSPGAVHALTGDSWKEAGRAAALLGDAVTGGGDDVFGAVEALSAGRDDAALVVRLLMAEVRREIRSRLGTGAGGEPGQALAGLSLDGLAGQLENLMMTGRMLEGNVNVKLAFGSLCRRWAEGLAGGPVRPIQREW